MIVTLRDVASRAGVSTSTVSRVIRDSGYIAPPTKQKVLEAIEELQYRPNNIARRLRYGRTYAIGFVLNDISNPFFSHAVKGAEQFLRNQRDNNYELFLFNTNSEPEREVKALEFMLDKHAEAIILASTTTDECIKKVHEVVERYHIPIVSIDNQLDGLETGIVTVENQVGAYQLTAHLLQHGHRRIGFISGPIRESHICERLQGCKQAVHEYGLDFDKQLVAYGNWTVEDGYRITMGWLDLKEPPTAIFGLNNFMCIGALSAIAQRGMKVPDQIALASFDDVEFGHLLSPCLTTLDYSYQKIGEEAVRLAMTAIETEGKETKSQLIRIPVRMIVRESCGCSL
jgi:LacI family transcriptional regulator, repressor for deo operon, udp, cdd, tsx, nupC, and nupG